MCLRLGPSGQSASVSSSLLRVLPLSVVSGPSPLYTQLVTNRLSNWLQSLEILIVCVCVCGMEWNGKLIKVDGRMNKQPD